MSSDFAKKIHSVNFGNKNTWDDWHLIPVTRPVISSPSLKYVSVDLAGADGELDLSEALTGYPVYENRRGSLLFRVVDDWSNSKLTRSRHSEIMNYLHGKRMQLILDEDRGYYYIGRFEVEDLKFKKIKEWADIEISYNLEPYKYEVIDSTEDWLWDPFNFETGVIRGYKDLVVDDFLRVIVAGSRKPVTPIINVTTSDPNFKVIIRLQEYPLVNGRNILPEVTIEEEEMDFSFYGDGTVTISFRGGSL